MFFCYFALKIGHTHGFTNEKEKWKEINNVFENLNHSMVALGVYAKVYKTQHNQHIDSSGKYYTDCFFVHNINETI